MQQLRGWIYDTKVWKPLVSKLKIFPFSKFFSPLITVPYGLSVSRTLCIRASNCFPCSPCPSCLWLGWIFCLEGVPFFLLMLKNFCLIRFWAEDFLSISLMLFLIIQGRNNGFVFLSLWPIIYLQISWSS